MKMNPLAGALLLLATFCLSASALTVEERHLLQKIERRTFDYFWEQANPQNGLIRDATTNQNASVSVIGFGLAGLCIGADNGWITRDQAYQRALITLRSFNPAKLKTNKTQVAMEHGHPYHWVSTVDGSWPNVEGIFATDTAVCMAGILTVGQYFKGTEVEKLSRAIYDQVDWPWFYNAKEDSLYLGWTPKSGHFGYYQMNEIGTLATLLAIASPTHPIPVSSWFTLGHRYFHTFYSVYSYFGDGAAYTHQWPFCFIDPRLKKDYFANYSENDREFALASRAWCMDHRGEGYGPNVWGLTMALGPEKYGNYGAPVIDNAPLYYNGQDNDGTVAPSAAIGFLPFVPNESMAFINNLKLNYGDKVFDKYGFTDSFNLTVDYFSQDHLGINQGPILLMIDNYLKGTVWTNFSNHPLIRQALNTIGLVGVVDNFDASVHSQPYAQWSAFGKGITFSPTDTFVKEQHLAMQVAYPARQQQVQVMAKPRLKSTTGYRYLGLWHAGVEDLQIKIMDTSDRPHRLKAAATVKDGAWSLSYFQLPPGRSLAVKTVLFTVQPRPNTGKPVFYLDDIHFSKELKRTLPPAPRHVEAVPGKHAGEVILTWQLLAAQVPHAAYTIKVADHPITTKTQFDHLPPSQVEYHGLMSPGQYQTTISGLTPGKTYTFGMATVNPIGLSSPLVTASTLTPSKESIIFDFDPKELTANHMDGWESFQSNGDQLDIIFIPAKVGYAMELNYVSDGNGESWFGIKKAISGRLTKSHRFEVNVKGDGLNTMMEFKLYTSSGAVFGKKIEYLPYDNKWHELVIPASDLTYWWGGNGSTDLEYIDHVELVFTANAPGRGRIAVNQLRARWK